jgi:hypothetical protein
MTYKKMASIALAGVLVTATIAASATEAEAYRGRRIGAGIAAGIIAGSVLGAYAYGAPRYRTYSSYVEPGCYKGPRQCDWAGRSCWLNRYGERVCSGGEWRCWSPTICD